MGRCHGTRLTPITRDLLTRNETVGRGNGSTRTLFKAVNMGRFTECHPGAAAAVVQGLYCSCTAGCRPPTADLGRPNCEGIQYVMLQFFHEYKVEGVRQELRAQPPRSSHSAAWPGRAAGMKNSEGGNASKGVQKRTMWMYILSWGRSINGTAVVALAVQAAWRADRRGGGVGGWGGGGVRDRGNDTCIT